MNPEDEKDPEPSLMGDCDKYKGDLWSFVNQGEMIKFMRLVGHPETNETIKQYKVWNAYEGTEYDTSDDWE